MCSSVQVPISTMKKMGRRPYLVPLFGAFSGAFVRCLFSVPLFGAFSGAFVRCLFWVPFSWIYKGTKSPGGAFFRCL